MTFKELVRFESRKSQIYQLANQYNVDPKLLSSIVFPELIRYSHLKDKVEISALYSLYVLFGKEFSNYSVGMFQMKPSFIEKLETEIVKYPDIETAFMINQFPDNLSEKNLKSLRIQRMTDSQWQVKYLISFMKIIEKNFFDYLSKIEDERDVVRFFSTAYNTGTFNNLEKIKAFSKKKFFTTKKGTFNFSDISIYFYENFLKNKNL